MALRIYSTYESPESAGSVSTSPRDFGVFSLQVLFPPHHCLSPVGLCRQALGTLVLFWSVFVFFLPRVLVPHHHHLNHLILFQETLGTLALFRAVSVFFLLQTSLSPFLHIVPLLPTERSSPNLVGLSTSFFIYLALLLYANSLAGSSSIFFYLLDTIL